MQITHSRDVSSDIQVTLNGTCGGSIRARCKNCQRHGVIDTAKEVSWAHTTARQAQQGIELPTARCHAGDKSFAKIDVLGPTDVYMLHFSILSLGSKTFLGNEKPRVSSTLGRSSNLS